MKVLLCHNYYQQPGGEDQVFAAEGRLLRSRGHEVLEYTKHNDHINEMSRWAAARRTVWNRQVYEELRDLIRRERPDILHATNVFPLISPAAYAAARDEKVPVVQSLHNYRLICPKALLMRNGRACESCLGKRFPWPGVVHACYRGSRSATAVVATMLAVHWRRGTWTRLVDRYIALTKFARQKMIEGGLPPEAISVKPNFLADDPGVGEGLGGYAVYVGRLSTEKGVQVLLETWSRISKQIPLHVVGDGPLAEMVSKAADRDSRIRWLGRMPHEQVLHQIGDARVLVFPSTCFETFGLSIVEAFAKGTPVIGSRLGAMRELVSRGRTGLHFRPGDPDDLAAKVQDLWDDDRVLSRMRSNARSEFESKYTADANYEMLLSIYEQVLGSGRTCPPADRQINEETIMNDTTVAWPEKRDVLGVAVTPTTYKEATETIVEAARNRQSAVVSCHAVHAVVTASCDRSLREKVNTFNMITPDGQPVRWALNLLHRAKLTDRVYGPDLTLSLCEKAAEQSVPVYLYGGSPEVVEKMRQNLLKRYPDLAIAGYESPPFRALTPEEDEQMVQRVNASGAGIVFIGLGCPKQDLFAYEHRDRIRAVQVCVGAAFDFHAGAVPQAPGWMQRRGLEWLYRLIQEPGRLWRRYLVTNTIFLAKLVAAMCRRPAHRGI